MYRLLWLLLVAFSAPLAGAMADVLWREDFEDEFVEERWYSDFGVWEFGLPTSGPTNAFGGTRLVGTILGSNYPENVTSRLTLARSLVIPPAEDNPRPVL